MSAASAQVLTHSAKVRAIRDYFYYLAVLSREDVKTFVEFVMRDYSKGEKRITLAAHQKLGLEFIRDHQRAILLWPPGFSKTFLAVGYLLWELGHDPTHRIGIISATMYQASAVLDLFRKIIESNPFLKMVFPHLCRSRRASDAWNTMDLVVNRPGFIKDSSVAAYGLDTDRPLGKRLSRVYADDASTLDNMRTKESRDKIKDRMQFIAFNRLDDVGGKALIAGNPWHPQDLPHSLVAEGWPMLRYDAFGDIEISEDRDRERLGLEEWDSDLIRRKHPHDNRIVRLVAHDPDPDNRKVLWPEKWGHAQLEEKRAASPGQFDQMFRCIVRDDDAALCKREYIEKCKDNARANGFNSLVRTFDKKDGFVFTGVDLAFGQNEEHDDTAIVTIAVLPWLKNMRVLLDVQIGKWSSPEILKRVEMVNKCYVPDVIKVENNGGQAMFRQFGLDKNLALPLRPYTTTARKAHPDHGIPGIFYEFANGAWAIPCNKRGEFHPHVERLVNACLFYTSSKHVDDPLMALFFAYDEAKKWGSFGVTKGAGEGNDPTDVMMR